MNTVFCEGPYLQDIHSRLQDEDREVRRIAILDLADLAGDEHAPLLVAALRDPATSVRQEAAKALEAFESDTAITGLIALLEDADAEVRRAAIASSCFSLVRLQQLVHLHAGIFLIDFYTTGRSMRVLVW